MINQKVENVTQTDFSLIGCFKHIEKAGRVCYGSESKITDDSYKSFIDMLLKNKHYSPFGHGTLVIDVPMLTDFSPYKNFTNLMKFIKHYELRCKKQDNGFMVVSARVIAEASDYHKTNFFEVVSPCVMDSDEIQNKINKADERITFKIVTSIAMSRELNRHAWSLDITERSTRYVRQFDYIKPHWYDTATAEQQEDFLDAMISPFCEYEHMLASGMPKQDARDVLPLCTATEVYYTSFKGQWEDVIAKRTAKGVHPQMIDLMNKIKEVL